MAKKIMNIDGVGKSADLSPGRFRALIENAYEGIILYDVNGIIQYASSSIKNFCGFTSHDLLGRNGLDFMYPEDVAGAREGFYKVLLHPGKSVTLVHRFINKKQEVRWAEYTLTNLLNKPAVKGIISNFRDIHEKKVTEEKAIEAQRLLNTVSDNIVEGVFCGIPDHEFQYVNKAFLEITGYKSLTDLREIKLHHLYVQVERWKEINKRLRVKKRVSNEQILFRRKGGECFWVSMNMSVVKNGNKQEYFVGSIQDITHQKRAEERLQKSQQLLSAINRNITEGIYRNIPDKGFVYVNRAFLKLFGFKSMEELNATTKPGELYAEKKYKNLVRDGIRKKGEVRNVEALFRKKTGEQFWGAISSIQIVEQDGDKYFDGAVRDITKQKEAEKQLEEINANLLGVMESTQESIYALDPKYNYIAFNKNHARMSKLIYGVTISIGDNILSYLKGTSEGKWLRIELNRAFRGEHFVSEHSLSKSRYKDKHIETTYNPILDKKNEVAGVAVFVRDITQRKRSEEKLRVLNDGLISQNWKLAAQEEELKATLEELSERNFELDQLMYKTSHDLRSPLSSILGLINLAHLDGNKENLLVYLNKIEGRVKKLDEFIRSMLNYARVNRSEIFNEQINLQELIANCIHELEYLENFSSVKTQTLVHNKAVPFKSDALRVKIIISNIISNAYKYYNSTVKSYLKIQVKITPLAVQLTFRDNGIGIKKEHVNKVFGMFYRATEKSQGSGLGMYIVKQAVDKLNGTIKVKSTFGKGTTIKIVLPNN